VIRRSVGTESGYGSDQSDAIPGCRVTPIEIVLVNVRTSRSLPNSSANASNTVLLPRVWPDKHRLALTKVNLSLSIP